MAGVFRISVQTQREIKDMKEKFKINDTGFICDGKYYFDEQEERFFFYPLSTNDTGLMTTLYIDESFAFERFNHPVWLYINNTYNQSERKFIPMLLDTLRIADNYQLNLFENDYLEIQSFVYQFKKLLILLANEKIKIKDFLTAVQDWKSSNSLNQIYENLNFNFGLLDTIDKISNGSINNNILLEMATLEPEETGLPMKLWVDTNKEYLRGKHGHCIKFQYAPHIRKTSDYATYTIPDGKILNLPDRYYDSEKLKLLQRFVDANKDNLIKLADNIIDTAIFKEHMIKLDERGYPISGNISEQKYRIIKTFDNNSLSMVIDKNKRYNFLNRYGVLMSDIWFDWADDFRYSGKLDRWVARAGKGDKIYVLLDNGNLMESQF